jgi:hypothetical protein
VTCCLVFNSEITLDNIDRKPLEDAVRANPEGFAKPIALAMGG